MDSYVIKGKLHDDVWFCSIFKHEKLMNSTPSTLAFHDNRLKVLNKNTVGTRFNDLEGTGEFWSLNPNVVKSNF